MEAQAQLEQILKHKGIGPEGSKSLNEEHLSLLKDLLTSEEVSKTTKATLLTAMLMLPANEQEQAWMKDLKNDPSWLPSFLHPWLNTVEKGSPYEVIQQLIHHEELSTESCEETMESILKGEKEDFYTGSFLEGERLKRETFAENTAFFKTLWKTSKRQDLDLSNLIDFCDSYDGYHRNPCYTPFVCATLASIGINAYVHGVDVIAPKMGTTAHQVLKLAGKKIDKNLEEASADLLNPEIGWTYIDQAEYFPELYQLKTVRKEMVKRPFLATFEKLLQPLRGTKGNHVITAYTHKHYKEEIIKLLQHLAVCQTAINLKGVESTCQPHTQRAVNLMLLKNDEITENTITPEAFSCAIEAPKVTKEMPAAIVLEKGLEALKGIEGHAFYQIIYQAAMVMHYCLGISIETSVAQVKTALTSGQALKHWDSLS